MSELDRRNMRPILIGAGLALVAGLLFAVLFLRAPKGPEKPPPASQGGLVVETGREDDARLDPARPLRCFVAGQFIGEVTLNECAKRNGVATDALDVGVDESGALAAAQEAGPLLTPLPPLEEPETPLPEPAAEPMAEAGPPGACWRHSNGEWTRLPGDLSLGACVRTLFSGRCERPGGASYGRWGQQTLRLTSTRVEISNDNRSFRPLIEQSASCAIP
jgi:hypothetical protein